MLTLQITKIFPLGSNCGNRFEGIAYDGCYFYLTVPKSCQIYQYDNCFKQKKCISVSRGYTSICYDREYKCFWAIVEKVHNKIFRLDMCFKEVDCITIQYESNCGGCITGLSCGYMHKKLLVTFDGYVASIEKHCNPTPCILQKATNGTKFTSVQGVCNYYITSFVNGMSQGLYLYSKTHELKLTCCVPAEYEIVDMATVYVRECCKGSMPELYILAIKGACYPYLIRCTLVDCEEDERCDKEKNRCLPIKIEDCHELINGGKSCVDIIESIALVETALAHILNAEGEKIQKILQISDDPCEILKVNDAVNQTIKNVTHLEHVLLSKLQLAKDLCSEMCEEDRDCNLY